MNPPPDSRAPSAVGTTASGLRRLVRRRPGDPGYFNSARAYRAGPGLRRGPSERPRGYYLDFSAKAERPEWPPPWLAPADRQLHVTTVQWALGAWERYLAGQGEEWLRAALEAADHLISIQARSGALRGALLHGFPMPHTFPVDPPWVSSIAQGELASLLTRLHLETGEERLRESALRALEPLRVPVSDGGVLAEVDGLPFYEEYPTSPPSLVLNGEIFALWGLFDAARALDDEDAGVWFQRGLEGLLATLDRYDTGYWSRYDLFPHPIPNLAGPFYHRLHIDQLRVLAEIAPHESIERIARRWEGYAASRVNRSRAVVAKVAFRLLVPRSRGLASRLPWNRRLLPDAA